MKKILLVLSIVAFVFSGCKKDPCEGVVCSNGGTCSSGTCSCTTGYTGSSCQSEVKPTSVRLKTITVTQFPMSKPTGGAWDANSCCPDIYVTVEKAVGGNVYTHPTYFNDGSSGTTYLFTMAVPVNLNPDTEYYIYLYDEDGATDEFLGGYSLFPYHNGEGFPTSRTFSIGPIDMTVTYEYNF